MIDVKSLRNGGRDIKKNIASSQLVTTCVESKPLWRLIVDEITFVMDQPKGTQSTPSVLVPIYRGLDFSSAWLRSAFLFLGVPLSLLLALTGVVRLHSTVIREHLLLVVQAGVGAEV